MPVVVPFSRASAIVTLFTGTGGELNGGIVHLFVNDFQPTIDSVLGDFDEATFTGYAASTAIVWSETFRNSLGQAQTVGDTKTFILDAGEGQTVFGYYVTVGGALRYSERLPQPIPLAVPGNAAVIVPVYAFGSV